MESGVDPARSAALTDPILRDATCGPRPRTWRPHLASKFASQGHLVYEVTAADPTAASNCCTALRATLAFPRRGRFVERRVQPAEDAMLLSLSV